MRSCQPASFLKYIVAPFHTVGMEDGTITRFAVYSNTFPDALIYFCQDVQPQTFFILKPSELFLFLFAFISPGQVGDGSSALGLGEPQLCADPQGPGGSACKPHQPDRLPLPS